MIDVSLKKLLAKIITALQKPSFTPKTTYNLANSDSLVFENGLIIKYGAVGGLGGTAGNTSAAGNSQRVTFPTPFPNNCFFVITGVSGIGPTTNSYSSYVNSSGWDQNGFYATINGINYAQASANTYWSTGYISYIAIGN